MSEQPDNLTGRQAKLLSALLTEKNVAAAAIKAGCSERAAYLWLKEPAFSAAYRFARREAVTHATARLQAATSKAVETLESVMGDTTALPSARVAAAKAVLETAYKAMELEDLALRVEELEAKLEELQPAAPAGRNGKAWAH